MSRALNEFIKGFLWGFVAFVHVALITTVIYKFKLNCLPSRYVEMLSCLPADSAGCPNACDPSNDFIFYILVGVTAFATIFLPLGFGVMAVVRSTEAKS